MFLLCAALLLDSTLRDDVVVCVPAASKTLSRGSRWSERRRLLLTVELIADVLVLQAAAAYELRWRGRSSGVT